MRPHDDGPSIFAWLVASVSLALPWAGGGLGLFGVWLMARGEAGGWYIAAGGALLIADILIDFVWAHPSVLRTDQPDLNRRGEQLVGRVLVVEDAIKGGRGKVRVADTLWTAEGPDLPTGTQVRVTGVRAAVLLVEQCSSCDSGA